MLAILVRENGTIEGIRIGRREVKVSLFADDVCYCRSKADQYRILDCLDRFHRYFELTLNKHKTKLILGRK